MQRLFTPWRYSYVSVSSSRDICFLCAAVGSDEAGDELVVHSTPHHVVLLNKFPYTNGHLLIAPKIHVPDPKDCASEAQAEFWPLVLECERVLERAFRPNGFNLGMNLGVAGGAGLPAHFHFHIVPRWEGDTNFMTVLGETRLVPQTLQQVRDRLRPLFKSSEGAE